MDYWDHQGWKDPFASKAFTSRQEAYAKTFGAEPIYTPQMVVDGRDELNGSDEPAARRAVQAAAARPHLPLRDRRPRRWDIGPAVDRPARRARAEPSRSTCWWR